MRQECETKLNELEKASSTALQGYVSRSRDAIDDIVKLPWVLSHDDLSGMNLLLDEATGHLTGVVDWADAALWPCGIALWGVESILGYQDSNGWTWLDDGDQTCRKLFSATLRKETVDFSAKLPLVEKARVLGLLLRYGFQWHDECTVPVKDTTMLEAFLNSRCRTLPFGD